MKQAGAATIIILIGCGALVPSAHAGSRFSQGRVVASTPAILPHRERAGVVNRQLVDRLDNLLPGLMRETGIDFWLVINREYAEDPVYLTLVSEPVFAARRTSMLAFFDRGPEKGVERITISRYPQSPGYTSAWQGGTSDSQWSRLAEVIADCNPRRIGINVSDKWAFADGLSAGLRVRLSQALDPALRSRIVGAEKLCIRWLESRTALELESYPQAVAIARSVISEAFSNKVITPGVTTTEDVAWYIRQRFEDLRLEPWFQPYVNIQRRGMERNPNLPIIGMSGIIQRGDVLHTDVGIRYLRLCTDTQEMAYVLRLGESDVPAGLIRAFAVGNRWQDILTKQFAVGRSGNAVLDAAIRASKEQGIAANIYSHPIGFHGHAAGPTIGMWDNQGPTPVYGDWLLHANTAYAIEGNVLVNVAEWGNQPVQIKLEQSALFDGENVTYLAGRQTNWHVIR